MIRILLSVWLATTLAQGVACAPPLASAAKAPAGPSPALRSLSLLGDLEGASLQLDGQPVLAMVFASWCTHCHLQLEQLSALRSQFPGVQIIGVSYPPHEQYDDRGSPAALRSYVAQHAPWLRVVAASEELFAQLGRPAKVPTLYGFDRHGQLVKVFDRRAQRPPTREELATLLRTLSSVSP